MDRNIIGIINDLPEDVFMVTLSLSLRCDQDCGYCMFRDNSKEFKTYEHYVSIIEKILSSLPDKKVDFYFHGGEPTILPRFYEIIKHFSEKYDNSFFSIQTNTNKSLDWFKQFEGLSNVSFICSYQHHQKIKRGIEFDVILEKFLWLYDNNLLNSIDFMLEHKNEDDILENLTILKNTRLSEIVVLMPVAGIENPNYVDVCNDSKMMCIVTTKGFLINTCFVVYKNGDIIRRDDIHEMKSKGDDNFRLFRCYAGKTHILVDDEGDVYRCFADRISSTSVKFNLFDNDLLDYISGKPKVCFFPKCICELDIKKTRIGWEGTNGL